MTVPDAPTLDIFTGPDTLAEVHESLAGAWAEHGEVPVAIRMDLEIAAAEIASNIIEHANRGGAVRLRMLLQVEPGEVRIVFTDNGIPALIDIGTVQMPDETAERGRGLALAKAVLADLSYERTADVNRWTLVSRRFP